jgi:hypothetical protein
MSSLRRVFSVSLAVTAFGVTGCGGSDRATFDEGASDGGSSSGSASSSGGFGTQTDAGASSSVAGQDGCSEAAKLVYVVSAENDLYSFQPQALAFAKIGRLSCPTSESPNSMAVDRAGNAWVNFSEGSLFKVSTKDASCTATPFQKGQSGFKRFGMAFASDAAGGTSETLYVVGISDLTTGKGLAKIDLTTFKLTTVGDFSGSLKGQGAELTGTGDAKLYGFFTTLPASLAEIDKASGATSGVKKLDGVTTGDAWAFSFWGGDFWFYTALGGPSRVTRLAASGDGSLKVVKPDVGGFRIVGAGVSTCAPTAPPR